MKQFQEQCRDFDVCFMPEHYWTTDGSRVSSGGGVNAGFLFANNNARSRAFFKDVLKRVLSYPRSELRAKMPLADQSVIQDMLKVPKGEAYDDNKHKLKWKTFEPNSVIGCCNGCSKVPPDALKQAYAHHAIACDTIGGRNNNKRRAFKALRRAVLQAQGTKDASPSILDMKV